MEAQLAKQQTSQDSLVDRLRMAKEAYRDKAHNRGMTPEQVEDAINKACSSPISNKLLMNIYSAHKIVEQAKNEKKETEQKKKEMLQTEKQLENEISNLQAQQQQETDNELHKECDRLLKERKTATEHEERPTKVNQVGYRYLHVLSKLFARSVRNMSVTVHRDATIFP